MAIKYALMSLCLISSGDDVEADSTTDIENQPAKTSKCKCGGIGYKLNEDEFDGQRVEVYKCRSCKKEFRVKA